MERTAVNGTQNGCDYLFILFIHSERQIPKVSWVKYMHALCGSSVNDQIISF